MKINHTLKVMAAIELSGFKYDVLQEIKGSPVHVRVKSFGDVWPATATYNIGGRFHKKDINGLLAHLSPPEIEQSKPAANHAKDIRELQEYCAFLEGEIDKIKSITGII